MHYFKRCSSNLTYTPGADLVPRCHDTGSHSGFRDISPKAKLSFAISVIKSLLQESKGSAWITGRRATTTGRWALSSHCLLCGTADLQVLLACGMGKRESTAILLGCRCHLAALISCVTRASPGTTNCLGFLSLVWKMQWCSPFYPLKPLLFSVLKDILYTFYHTLHISVKDKIYLCCPMAVPGLYAHSERPMNSIKQRSDLLQALNALP